MLSDTSAQYEYLTAEEVSRPGFNHDGNRPHMSEVAQAQHLVAAGNSTATLETRNSWYDRQSGERIVFLTGTPYEYGRFNSGYTAELPTKNLDTFEWRYIVRDAPEGWKPCRLIMEQIFGSDGSLFYEKLLVTIDMGRDPADLLSKLNEENTGAYYMQWANFSALDGYVSYEATKFTKEQLEWSAGHLRKRLMTPAEIAAETDTNASTWRNKAAAGNLPGSFKKGKQWLIPRILLIGQGVLTES